MEACLPVGKRGQNAPIRLAVPLVVDSDGEHQTKGNHRAIAACVLLAAAWQNSAASPLAVIDMASYEADGRILGAGVTDKLGQSVAAGDFNGDDIEDILVGADEADGPGPQ
jgi:hypothetical protein